MATRHLESIEVDRIFLYEENPRHEQIDSEPEIYEHGAGHPGAQFEDEREDGRPRCFVTGEPRDPVSQMLKIKPCR
jgi:hypothetical protein